VKHFPKKFSTKIEIHDNDPRPLHLATEAGHLDTMQLLLDHGSDPDTLNDSKMAPLHTAALKGFTAGLTLLINSGAQVQGYHMVSFQTPQKNLGIFWRTLEWKILFYICIFWSFIIFYDH
jgi:ankyrin repeat protein